MGGISLQSFRNDSQPAVVGFLHRPATPNNDGMVLTHGAGSDCNSALLVACAKAFTGAGFTVLCCDLPFRQSGKPPHFSATSAARDREGLRNAAAELRKMVAGKVFLGGHSYGGRQSSMLAAAEPEVADGLLLLSYPLHPPRKPEQRRTEHLPNLQTAALFVHGTRDPFGSPEEMEQAVKLIPARTSVRFVEGAGHDLVSKRKAAAQGEPVAEQILEYFVEFFGAEPSSGAKS